MLTGTTAGIIGRPAGTGKDRDYEPPPVDAFRPKIEVLAPVVSVPFGFGARRLAPTYQTSIEIESPDAAMNGVFLVSDKLWPSVRRTIPLVRLTEFPASTTTDVSALSRHGSAIRTFSSEKPIRLGFFDYNSRSFPRFQAKQLA